MQERTKFHPVAGVRAAAVSIFLLVLCGTALGGIGPNGFFDEYLLLGPYSNPGGDSAGVSKQTEDFLCDGTTSEDSIVPREGLVLGRPSGSCASPDSGFTGPGDPTIVSAQTSGDLLDLIRWNLQNLGVAYAWVHLENLTHAPLSLTLAFSSDDGAQVKLNGSEVFNISAPIWYGAAGTILFRAPVTLLPGVNLMQFKVFQGYGVWGVRARLEDPATGLPLLDGDARIRVGVVGTGPGGARALRHIAVESPRAVGVSVAFENKEAPYSLHETFGPGWSVVDPSGSPTISGRTLIWQDTTEPELSYRLVRTRPFTREEGLVVGYVSVGEDSIPVAGDRQIPGFSPATVGEVLLSPPFSLAAGVSGCSIPQSDMHGPWIGDGGALTDESILPREGFEFRPDFGGFGSRAAGFVPIGATDVFWTNPGDPKARLARTTASAEGLFDFNRIYSAGTDNSVNAAYFYVVNETGAPLTAVLALGSDDGAAMRLNGQPVWSLQTCRPISGFQDRVPLSLRAGKNLIDVNTFNGGSGYGLTLRFEDEPGIPIAVETTLDPEGYVPPPAPPECLGELIQTGFRRVSLVLDHRISIRGGELGIAYDPAAVSLTAVRAGGDLPPDVQLQVQKRPANQCPPEAGVSAGLTAAWILPPGSPTLPRGKHEVLELFFAPLPGTEAGACSPIRFVSCLGVAGAPVTNVVTDAETKSISIISTDGQICFSGEPSLLRGDVNGDGRFDISDPIGILSCLFLGESCGVCPDASDVDDNGEREITDAILLLGWRFLDGQPPAPPFPGCGLDPTLDLLSDCAGSSCR